MSARTRILHLLLDLSWHSYKELGQICNRYGARLHELRQVGYTILRRPAGAVGSEYRLMSTPQWLTSPRRPMVRVYLPATDVERLVRNRELTLRTVSSCRRALRKWKKKHG